MGLDSGWVGGHAMSLVRRPSVGDCAKGGVLVPDVGEGGCQAFMAVRLDGLDGKPSLPLNTSDFGGGQTNCFASCELWRDR